MTTETKIVRRVSAQTVFHKAVGTAAEILKENNIRTLTELVEDYELFDITHEVQNFYPPVWDEEKQSYEYPFMPSPETHGETDYRSMQTAACVLLTDEEYVRLSTKDKL